MAKIKDFAKKVLLEIELAHKQEAQSGRPRRELPPLSVFECELANDILCKKLEEYSKDEVTEVSEQSLKPLLSMLARRFTVIARTNGSYNADPYSPYNLAFITLAKSLFTECNALREASDRKQECFTHYYDCLFGLSTQHFISSKGQLGDLPLSAFFWSVDLVPVETAESLRQFMKCRGKFVQPQHVCLTEKYLQAREVTTNKKPNLHNQDIKTLVSHSKEAEQLYSAIFNKQDPNIVQAHQEALDAKCTDPKFVPGYVYRDMNNKDVSVKHLIESGFLMTLVDKSMLVKTGEEQYRLGMRALAHILSVKVPTSEWDGIISHIETEDLYSMVLPAVNNEPDIEVLNSDNFQAFIDNPDWYLQDEPRQPVLNDGAAEPVKSRHTNALMYLMADLYERKRASEDDFTGVVGKITGFGCAMKDKLPAAQAFKQFTKSVYFPTRLDEYLKHEDLTMHQAAFSGDRLLLLKNKASNLGNASAEHLANAARKLAAIQSRADWPEAIERENILTPELLAYIQSCGRPMDAFATCLTNCMKMSSNYIQGDKEGYNKAVLYIFTLCYLNDRGKNPDDTKKVSATMWGVDLGGYLPKLGFKKDDKLAAGQEFLRFLESDHATDELAVYMKKDSKKPHLLPVMLDIRSLYSVLGNLVQTAEKVCTSAFYAPPAKEARSGLLARIW